ncbi:MAG: NUDIX domain-containing protein [Bacteroidaceae bacterium]|nr:NUDIX domain-containing protein [Bacteroidaceae bacterium]
MNKSDNQEERLPLVDEQGNVIGSASRGECHNGSHLLHPVVHLHVFNPQGDIYLQHRPAWKDIQPDKWDTAVGGHVDYGESIKQALAREVSEELGITEFKPEFLTRYIFESARDRELVYAYKATTTETPKPSDELDGGRFFSSEEIQSLMGKDFFTPNFEQEYKMLFGYQQ